MTGQDIVISIGGDDSNFRAVWDKIVNDVKNVPQVNIDIGANQAASQATNLADRSLPRIRYALYDISATAKQTSNALYDTASGVIKTAADYESAFTTVERTSGITGKAAIDLKKNLMQLAEQIPVSFADLSKISSLGAQLGIAPDSLAQFTENVAKFSATTNVSVEQAAMSFGSLGELLGFTTKEYNNFSSAVGYAGSKSVATETEILAVATQIGGVASNAKFSAKDVLGLSTALSTLRIPAEQSRGALTRFLQEVTRASAEGGQQIETFANIMGVSKQQATNLANTDMSGFFNKFIEGMSQLDPSQMTLALDALNLNEIRVTNTITRLAGHYDVLKNSQDNVTKGWDDGTWASEKFSKLVDDLNSKFTMLQSSFDNAGSAIGQYLLPAAGFLVDVLTNVGKGLKILADNPFIGFIIALSVGLIALTGVVTAFIAGFSFMAATIFAGTTAFENLIIGGFIPADSMLGRLAIKTFGLSEANLVAAASAKVLETAEEGVAAGAGVAAAGFSVLRTAMISSGIGIAVVAIGGLIAALTGAQQAALNTSISTTEYKNVNGLTAEQVDQANKKIDEQKSSMENLASSTGGATTAIRTLVDYSNDLAKVYSRAFDIRFSGQSSFDNVTKGWNSITKSTADARKEVASLNQDINSLNADIQGLTADKQLKQYFLTIAEGYGDTLRAAQLRAEIAKIDSSLAEKSTTLKDKNTSLADAQNKTNKTLVGNSEAAIQNRSDILGLVQSYQEHIKTLAASGMKQEDLQQTTTQLRQDFIDQATQLGYNQTELGKYASAFDDTRLAIDKVPRNITVGLEITGIDAGIAALTEFEASAKTSGTNAANNIKDAIDKLLGSYEPPVIEVDMKLTNNGATLWDNLAYDMGVLGDWISGASYRPLRALDFHGVVNPDRSSGSNDSGGGGGGGGYASGGYTGAGSQYDVAGIVHKGEYVVPANQVNQATQLPYFMEQPRQYFNGTQNSGSKSSPTTMIVELSPTDRQLLAQAGNVQLAIDGRVVAGATNRSNLVSAQRGTN